MWSVGDVDIKFALVFVPAGEPLPEAPARRHMHPAETSECDIPLAFTVCNTDHTHTVREFLARQAEEATDV